jgi:membrane fusion protein
VAEKTAAPLPLFRNEVAEAKSSQWLGSIRLAQPVSTLVIAVVALLVSICLACYVTFGSVTKKARVAGITIPSTGSLSIVTPGNAVLVRTLVAEGQQLQAGQPMFELSTERQGSKGEISALVAQQIAIRKQTIEAERRSRIAQTAEKRRALEARLQNLNAEIAQLEDETTLAGRRQALAQKSLQKFETLEGHGFVSSVQTQQKQEDLIDVETRMSSLARTRAQLLANRVGMKAEQDELQRNLATELAQLERAEASLNVEQFENEYRKSNIVVAPEAGTVTTVTNLPGQAVKEGQVLATLIPSRGASLEVHLYAPSRTAGFVAAGQTVFIRYQAFPYQKFGLQQGLVVDVSRTPFAPDELPTNLASTILSNAQRSGAATNINEALYRIRVRLAKQTIDAYGTAQNLKPGMTLEADIVQDRRRIWEWIAEPVLAVARR